MSRFNEPSTNTRKTVNHEGEVAFAMTPELDLYSQVCTASLQPKFYSPDSNDQILRLRDTISKVDPELVCKLAVYAREKMYLRSVPLVLMVELLKNFNDSKQKGKRDPALLKKSTTRVIQRADEITEILSYFVKANNRTETKKLGKLPNAFKKAVAESFHKFDEYQLAKYNKDGSIKLRDALFLTHPKPSSDKQKELFKKLVDNSLSEPYTWEVEFSKLGQQTFNSEEEKTKAFSEKWKELVESKKLGYMALMRNLRNILKYGASKELINSVCEKLTDPKEVLNSKQLPFRYWSAFRSLGNEPSRRGGYSSNIEQKELDPFAVKQINNALEKAIKISIDNLSGFGEDTRVLIASDVSGSMQSNISENSQVQYYDIGLLLGQLLQSKCKNVVTGFFGDDWKVTNFSSGDVLNNTLELHRREGEVGYSTNGYKVIQWLNTKNVEVDKVMIFTDCQLWNSSGTRDSLQQEWHKYRQKFPKAKLYLFDLAGYGNVPLDIHFEKNVYLIAGWSEKIFEVMEAIENGGNAIDFIKNIKI